MTQQFLGRTISFLGYIPRDPHVSQAVMQTYPFSLRYPTAPATKQIGELADRLIQQRAAARSAGPGFFRRFAETLGLASSA